MEDALVEAIIRFQAQNLATVEEAKLAVGGLGSQVSGVNVQLAGHKTAASAATTAERGLSAEANAAARAMGSLGDRGAYTVERMAALGGVMGSTSLALGAGVVALGALVVTGQAAVKNADDLEKANKDLEQAYASQGLSLQENGKWVDAFLTKNARFIDNQYEARDAIAAATRSGLSQSEVQRVLNDALDLAAIKNISVKDATTDLIDAEHGHMRSLIDLGVTTQQYTDANGNLIQSQHSVAQTMAEVDAKLKDGRNSTTELTQSQRELNRTWQDFTAGQGPQVTNAMISLNHTLQGGVGLLGAYVNATEALDAALGRLARWALSGIHIPVNVQQNGGFSSDAIPSGGFNFSRGALP